MANKANQMVTGEVRISYEHLLKPYANQQGQEEKYSCTILIPKSDVNTKARMDAAIRAGIQEGVGAKFGGQAPAQPNIPLHDGDGTRPTNGDEFGPECKGHWVITASSKQPVEIVDATGNPIISATEIYSGMYARVHLTFYPYNTAGRKGIGCGLGPVQKLREGEPLAGRVSAADAFGGAQDTPPWAGQAAQQPTQPMYQAPAQPMYQAPAYQSAQPAINPMTGLPY